MTVLHCIDAIDKGFLAATGKKMCDSGRELMAA